jgi:hypothetical protein
MDPSLIIQVADAVVTELTTANLGFTPQRHYRPQFELAELAELRVSVVPKGVTITSLGRGANQHDIAIDVALQKKVDVADTAALDGLMNLVQQTADALRLRRLTAMPLAAWIKTENAPIYAPEHLENKGVFTSVLTVTFRVAK